MLKRTSLAALAVLVALVSPASAQDTRADEIQKQREEKAQHLGPYRRGKVERALYLIEDRYLTERVFNPPRGIFARVGGLPEGAGLAAGPGYRYSNYSMSLTATAAMSIRGSQEADVRLAVPPPLLPARGYLSFGARYRNLPQEDFYGIGNFTRPEGRTAYTLKETSVDATAGVLAAKWLRFGGTLEYRAPRIEPGQDPRFPSIEKVFPNTLVEQPDYVRVGTSATIDYTGKPDGTLVGGRYRVSFDRYLDQDLNSHSFGRWDVDLQQYIPIATSARSLVLRARAAGVSPDRGDTVPFYLQPWLGGSHSLRGARAYRLRDQNALLLQAEYRWEVNAFLAGALFYDAGKVAPDRRDLDFKNLKDDYGIGLRLGFLGVAAVRAELVFGGDEGTVFALRFGDVF